MLVILLFILILNIVSMVLIYYCLGDLEKKEKLIFIAAGIAIMYIITTIVYWISTIGIEINEVSETGKNLIVFLFVPVNSLIILPLLAKSYTKLKFGSLDKKIFFKRGIALSVLLIIAIVFECVYFKNIQEEVVNIIKQNMQIEQRNEDANELLSENVKNMDNNELNYDNNQINLNEVNDNQDNINIVDVNKTLSN